MESISISCDECVMRRTSACHDCVVTFVLGLEAGTCEGTALVVDAQEHQALRLLAGAGLVPRLRHAPRCRGGAA